LFVVQISLDRLPRKSDECVCEENIMTATEQKRVISESTELGIGFLIAESEDGAYEPVGAVATIREAREIADSDMRRRMQQLETGSEPMYPFRYRVWAQGAEGKLSSVAEFEAN
jgi:hypothetical protein